MRMNIRKCMDSKSGAVKSQDKIQNCGPSKQVPTDVVGKWPTEGGMDSTQNEDLTTKCGKLCENCSIGRDLNQRLILRLSNLDLEGRKSGAENHISDIWPNSGGLSHMAYEQILKEILTPEERQSGVGPSQEFLNWKKST